MIVMMIIERGVSFSFSFCNRKTERRGPAYFFLQAERRFLLCSPLFAGVVQVRAGFGDQGLSSSLRLSSRVPRRSGDHLWIRRENCIGVYCARYGSFDVLFCFYLICCLLSSSQTRLRIGAWRCKKPSLMPTKREDTKSLAIWKQKARKSGSS